MEIFEFSVWLEAQPEDIHKLSDHGFLVHSPYGVVRARKNFSGEPFGLDIFAHHQFGFLKLVIFDENPNDEIRRYDDMPSFDIVEMFYRTDVAKLVKDLGLKVVNVNFKQRKNYVDHLMSSHWEEGIANMHYLREADDVSYRKLDLSRETDWEFNDDAPEQDLSLFLFNLITLGFPVSAPEISKYEVKNLKAESTLEKEPAAEEEETVVAPQTEEEEHNPHEVVSHNFFKRMTNFFKKK